MVGHRDADRCCRRRRPAESAVGSGEYEAAHVASARRRGRPSGGARSSRRYEQRVRGRAPDGTRSGKPDRRLVPAERAAHAAAAGPLPVAATRGRRRVRRELPGAGLTPPSPVPFVLAPHPYRDLDGGADEAELLAQPAFEEAAVTGLEKSGAEDDESRRPDVSLRRKEHLGDLSAA